MRSRALIGLLLLCLAAPAPAASARRDAAIAALQVALRARGVYAGPVDGLEGRGTTRAVMELQQRTGLLVDGIVGPQTRRALGWYARHRLGSRPLSRGRRGWDVAALQFLLAVHGFPSGPIDGHLGARSEKALLRYQRWAGLPEDGVAGPSTIASLRSGPPRAPRTLSWPLQGPVGDVFGPRGNRFHAGIDIKAGAGVGVVAAGSGRVAFAGWRGNFGYSVLIRHRRGLRTLYAHLSRVDVRLGQRVEAGAQIGLVGTTGHSTGPHLHFEVRVRGAAIDPLSALS